MFRPGTESYTVSIMANVAESLNDMKENPDIKHNTEHDFREQLEMRSDLEQQIKQRARLLLSVGDEGNSNQPNGQTGLSKDILSSWQRMWEKQHAEDKQPVDELDIKPDRSPILEKNSNGAYEWSNRLDVQQVEQMATNTNVNGNNGYHNSPARTLWVSGKGDVAMSDTIELRKIINILLRRWWLVLLLTLMATFAGYTISQRIKPVYLATTSVIVGQSIEATTLDSRDIQTSERLALSYADISRRQPVLNATIEVLDLPYTWQALRKKVSVSLVPNTQLLEISVEGETREEAVRIADELARQLILLSPASLRNRADDNGKEFVQQRLAELQSRIESNSLRVEDLTDTLSEPSTAADERNAIQAEINALETLVVELENTYARFLGLADGAELANYIAVVDQAYAKQNPIRPSVRLNMIIAGAIGFGLAIGLIFILELLDDTLKTEDDIIQDLGLTPLGSVGRVAGQDFLKQKIVSKDPFSPMAESYRIIRNNIQFLSIDKPGRTILVTSPGPGDGKSSTVTNLSITMASNGYKTILVDADIRKPVLHKVFGFPNGRGLTNEFRSPNPGEDLTLWETEIQNLEFLNAGDLPPNPSELLGSQKMNLIMSSLKEKADIIFFDSAPAAFIADPTVLSKRVDGVVLVVSAGKTRKDVARRAVFNLQQAGANVMGAVLNQAAETNGRYRYYAANQQHHLSSRIPDFLQNAWETLSFADWRKRRFEG